MTAKHSPLPWCMDPIIVERVLDATGEMVAEAYTEADAELIVAAANAHAALVSALEFVGHHRSCCVGIALDLARGKR